MLVRDGQILLLRRFQTGYEDGKYCLVAGHMDGHETARMAAIREAREEAGVTIAADDLRFLHVMHRSCPDEGRGYQERVAYFFMADQWQGEVKNMEPDKCDEFRWCASQSLPADLIDYVRQGIEAGAKGVTYSEHGW